jgi:hypothetical protein
LRLEKTKNASTSLKNAARAAVSTVNELGRIDDDEAAALGERWMRDKYDKFEALLSMARYLAEITCRVGGLNPPWLAPTPPSERDAPAGKRGRPRGSYNRKTSLFRSFVFKLDTAARLLGGRFTFDEITASGTLADTIERLRKYLPADIVPEPIGDFAATLKRIVGDGWDPAETFARVERELDGWDPVDSLARLEHDQNK